MTSTRSRTSSRNPSKTSCAPSSFWRSGVGGARYEAVRAYDVTVLARNVAAFFMGLRRADP